MDPSRPQVQPSAVRGDERALLVLLNFADAPRRALRHPVPLYYAGLVSGATCVAEYGAMGGADVGGAEESFVAQRTYPLDAQAAVRLPESEVPPMSAAFYVIREGWHCAESTDGEPHAGRGLADGQREL